MDMLFTTGIIDSRDNTAPPRIEAQIFFHSEYSGGLIEYRITGLKADTQLMKEG